MYICYEHSMYICHIRIWLYNSKAMDNAFIINIAFNLEIEARFGLVISVNRADERCTTHIFPDSVTDIVAVKNNANGSL